MPPKQQKAPKQPLKIYYSEEEKRRDVLQRQQQQQQKQQQQSKAKPVAARAGPVRSKRTFSAAQSSAPYSVDRLPNRFEKKKAAAAAAPASSATTTAPAARKAKRSYSLSLKTAEAIASDRTHPKQTEVIELLKTLERGWIDADRFSELLAQLIL